MAKAEISGQWGAIFPSITYNTNACGEHHTGRVPKRIMDAIPFEDGPGVVLVYLVTIGGGFYALGNLEVAYDAPVWDGMELESEETVRAACKEAVKVMSKRAGAGVIVFPVDNEEMPDRCVISVAVPVTNDSTRDSIRARLAAVFGEYQHADDRLIKEAA